MDCLIISEDDIWARELETRLSAANVNTCRHTNKSYPTTEDTLYLVDSNGRQPDIADCGKRIILFTDKPDAHNAIQLPRTHAAQWLLNHLGLSNNGLPLTWGTHATEGQLVVSRSGIILAANDTLASCLNGVASDWVNKPISHLFTELQDKPNYPVRRHLHRLCEQDQPCSGQLLEARNTSGKTRYLEVCTSRLPGERFLMNCRDVTQRTSSHRAMKQKARFDALTGLANRQLLMDRLRMALARSKRFSRKLAVMYIDLDHFKNINDSWGHAAGDSVLRDASQRMKDTVREIDTVARLGGDEFVIVIEDLRDHRDAAGIAENILKQLSKTFYWQQHEFNIGGSIGIAISGNTEDDANSLLEKADLALYRAKHQGRNNFEFCTSELSAQARYKLILQEGLEHALADNQLQLHFQPVVSMSDQSVTGAEVLLRWMHPKVGMVSPKDFIPLLEQTGLIIPVGEWIIEEACKRWKKWQKQGLLPDSAQLAFNISNCQFHSQQLLACIRKVMKRQKMKAGSLALEVTESLLSSDNRQLNETFRMLTDAGADIIMDDFGLGETSLLSMSQHNLAAIKLEQPLVDSLISGRHRSALKTFTAFAHSLDIRVIAEGVDDTCLIEGLRAADVDYYQGFSFASPMNAKEFTAFLARHRDHQEKVKILA